jgi:hypothetical protein
MGRFLDAKGKAEICSRIKYAAVVGLRGKADAPDGHKRGFPTLPFLCSLGSVREPEESRRVLVAF